jgi:hypothetical protein
MYAYVSDMTTINPKLSKAMIVETIIDQIVMLVLILLQLESVLELNKFIWSYHRI